MRNHGIRVLLLLLVFAAFGSIQAGTPADDTTVAARGASTADQRLTGFGGILESRLEALLRWVRDVFGDDQPINGNGLTDDPDPTSYRLGTDPEAPFEEDPAAEQEEEIDTGDGDDVLKAAYQRN